MEVRSSGGPGDEATRRSSRRGRQPRLVAPPMPSELGVARGARKRDDVADVLHAGQVHQHALDTEAKPRVRSRAKLAKLEVPPVSGLGQLLGADLLEQNIVALFALTASDDLSDARRENI